MKRYVVRHEFFGGLIYDRKEDTNIMIDDDFFNLLKAIYNNSIQQEALDEYLTFLQEEEFIVDNELNFRLIDTPFTDETLSAPGRVHFYYTSQCNLNCAHCFTKHASVSNEMSIEEKKSMLNQMYDMGINEILIGGGEPFIKKDFPDFVEACLEKEIITKVFSNGLLIDDDSLIDRMSKWNLKYLSISIDGANDDEYEKVRGVRGLETIRRNIKKIKEKCNFTIAASITINPFNYDNAENLLALIHSMGFDRLKVRPVKPAGNVMENRDVFLTAEQYSHFIRTTQKTWNEKYSDSFTLDFSWGDTRLIYNPKKKQVEPLDITYPYEGYGCFAGKVNIVFDAAGNAITCGFLPDNLTKSEEDNLRNKTIKEIWDSGQKFLGLRDLPGNIACQKCKYYGICRGGCMARNLFVGRDINAPDPWCLKKYFPIKIK